MANSSDSGGQPQGRRIKVAVVFGGRGPEHPISCLGGGNVLRVIDRDRYEVIPIGITTEGAWLEVADDPAKLAITSGELPTVESVAKPDAHVVPWAYQGDTSVVASALATHVRTSCSGATVKSSGMPGAACRTPTRMRARWVAPRICVHSTLAM